MATPLGTLAPLLAHDLSAFFVRRVGPIARAALRFASKNVRDRIDFCELNMLAELPADEQFSVLCRIATAPPNPQTIAPLRKLKPAEALAQAGCVIMFESFNIRSVFISEFT